jgi:hypothetical protein
MKPLLQTDYTVLGKTLCIVNWLFWCVREYDLPNIMIPAQVEMKGLVEESFPLSSKTKLCSYHLRVPIIEVCGKYYTLITLRASTCLKELLIFFQGLKKLFQN